MQNSKEKGEGPRSREMERISMVGETWGEKLTWVGLQWREDGGEEARRGERSSKEASLGVKVVEIELGDGGDQRGTSKEFSKHQLHY